MSGTVDITNKHSMRVVGTPDEVPWTDLSSEECERILDAVDANATEVNTGCKRYPNPKLVKDADVQSTLKAIRSRRVPCK